MIEVLVTIVLVSVALVGVLGGLRSLQAADAQARTADLLQRLASEQINELTVLPNRGAGNFADQGNADVSWTATTETTAAADIDKLTVTATRGRASQTLTTLLFVRPTLATGAPAP